MFEEIKQEKRKIDESQTEKKLKKDDLDDNFGDTLKCQICMEVMFQPVSLYPCLHNFCGGCFSD